MFTLLDLVQPKSIEEAYNTLINRRNNTVLGGCAFLKMGSKRIGTAIDLSNLDLNYIKEQDGYIEIGAMTTLRELETSELLNSHFTGVLPKSVSNIIGVQFRNVVTVGASVFSKYGFSDLVTALLALDSEVELVNAGRMQLAQFLTRPLEKDILTRIFIKKDSRQAVYKSLRNSASDYPILNVAVSRFEKKWTLVVGARPQRAEIAIRASEELSQQDTNIGLTTENIEVAANLASNLAADELCFGTNARGSAEYRRKMCKVLLKRAVMEVVECK